jgi:hypothetical protein
MQIMLQLGIPLRIICVQCNAEITGKPNDPIAQCPVCGFKVRIEAGAGLPMGPLGGLPNARGKTPALRRPSPVA